MMDSTDIKAVQQNEYFLWLKTVKEKIRSAQIRAALAASRELILFYWELGRDIYTKQQEAEWGSSFIDVLSGDLKEEFPDMKGFSAKNLRYCRAFFLFYFNDAIWQRPVAKLENEGKSANQQLPVTKMNSDFETVINQYSVDQIPWGHNILIFTKAHSIEEALFYINETISNGWSRDVLAV